jgi:hypothetical protein
MVAAAVTVCTLVAALVGGPVADAADDDSEARLPTVLNAPGSWLDDQDNVGPVAAIGLASRTRPVGLFDERQTLSCFTTSALDGSLSWLALPGFNLDRSGFAGGVAVSPDGRWIGWVRTARGNTVLGWSVRETTTGRVRNLEVEGYNRVRPTVADLAFSGDSRFLLTSFETPDQPKHATRGHQFVAWNVSDGTPTVLEEPGLYWLPQIGYADQGVVWSRSHEVFRADPETGRREVVTLPRTVLMASWAPGDAAFAYLGRDDRKKGDAPADERLYVGVTPSGAKRVVDLPDTSPMGEFLVWRDSTHVVLGDYHHGVYVVDITDGSYDTLDLTGAGEQINTPLLAIALWTKPLRPPVPQTGTSDPRRPWRWAGLVLFVVLLGAGIVLLRRADQAAQQSPRGIHEPRRDAVTQMDPEPAVERIPPVAWTMAWLFLIGQVVELADRGANTSHLIWVLASMALAALAIRWFAEGVLLARRVRLGIVWTLLSAAVSLSLIWLVVGADEVSAGEIRAFAFTAAQLLALGIFSTTSYFRACRQGLRMPRHALAPLLMIAAMTGLLGGLTKPALGEGQPTHITVKV